MLIKNLSNFRLATEIIKFQICIVNIFNICDCCADLKESREVAVSIFLRARNRVCFTTGLKMKLKVVWRKVSDYVRYDLKEIAFPSSLPDPPHIKKRRKLTLKERYLVLKEASRLYAASWVRDIGPELRPYEYKKKREIEGELDGENGNRKEKEPSTLEDLAVAARGGMETLRPALQRVYLTRASAYKDALKSFIQGYQEGIQQIMEKTEDSKSSKDTDASNSKGPT